MSDTIEITERDYVMARLAAARSAAQSTVEAIDEALAMFVDPEEDSRGKERTELVDAAIEAAGCASRALEDAAEILPDVDFEEGEPWEDEEDEDDEEEEQDEKPRRGKRRA